MVVINDTLGVRGGTMTLLFRMCKWYVEHGEKACVLYEADGNDEIKSKIEALGVKTYFVGFFNLKRIRDVLSNLIHEEKQVKVLNYNLNHYLDIEYVRSKYDFDIKNVMYVIHPDCLKKGMVINNGFVRNLYQKHYFHLITEMINNRALVFMDKDSIDATNYFYNKSIPDEVPIIPLPIDIPLIDNNENLIKKGYESNTILTAARADFPFKGYLLGLIDVFVELKRNVTNAKLKIFSEGEDIKVLIDKIDILEEGVKQDIELSGWIDYDGLIEEIKNCRVFIGASTGLLDSSKYYRVSIPVKHTTNKCVSLSFFHEHPMLLSEEYHEGMPNKCLELFQTVFNDSYEEYRQMSLSSFDAVNRYYNESVVMEQLNDVLENNNHTSLRGLKCIFHGTYHFLNKFRFKS